MRVYAQVSEGADPDEFQKEYTKRLKALTKLRNENLAMQLPTNKAQTLEARPIGRAFLLANCM